MSPTLFPVFVCIHARLGDQPSCGGRGSEALLAALQKGIAERGLAAEILPIRCMGFCAIGPNVRLGLGKDAQLLHGVTLDQAPDILDKIAVKAGKI